MYVKLNPEQEAFRQEVATFLEESIPEESLGGWQLHPDPDPATAGFFKKLADRGWVAPALPKEWGGAGLSYMEHAILNLELGYRRAPHGRGIGPSIAAPSIMHFGTDEQKKRFLTKIAREEEVWCQGFSEPDAGSDLASLRCAAYRDGDEYVVNGTKIWTSYSHFADWIMLLVRTDPAAPKHKGITALAVDRRTPGIELRPIPTMMDVHHFNQVYFTDVRVPVENRLGEENAGWLVTTTALDYERSGIGGVSSYTRTNEDFAAWFREHRGAIGAEAAVIRHEIAELAVEIAVGEMLAWRIASMQSAGLVPNAEASMAKVYVSEAGKRLYTLGWRLLGLHAQLRPESRHVELEGRVERNLQWDIVLNIAAGSSEIQRNIIAQRGLGLPR